MLRNVCGQREGGVGVGEGSRAGNSHIRGPCIGYISPFRFAGKTRIICGADYAGVFSIRQISVLCDC